MPTYEYKCLECGHRFEAFQSMTDPLLRKCDACGGKLKRLIGTGAGFIFKGAGFYATDYRSESYRQAEKKESSSVSAGSDASTKSAPPKKKPAVTTSTEGKTS